MIKPEEFTVEEHEQFTLEEHQDRHEKHLKALRDCQELIHRQMKSNSSLRAQLDFHMLMPCLFHTSGVGSRQVHMDIRHWLPNVLQNQAALGIEFYLTPFTYLEFLDQLKHQADTAETVLTDLISNGGKIDKLLLKDPKKLIWLSALLDGGYEHAVNLPLRTFTEWVDTGRLRKIGDLKRLPNTSALQKHQADVDHDFVMHRTSRLRQETERAKPDSVFHYRVDAANMWISKILSNAQIDLFMFTNTAATLNSMREEGLARHDHSLASFSKLSEYNSHEESYQRLQDAIGRLETNLARMQNYKTVADFKPYLKEQLTDYYVRIYPTVFPLWKAPAAVGGNQQALFKQIQAAAKNKKHLEERQESVKRDIREGVRNLHAKVFNGLRHDAWNAFGLDIDPIYQGIHESFDLSSVAVQV